MSYQQITLVGRLGADPEYKEPNPELKVANISVATSKKVKGEDRTEWHKVVMFNKTAEIANQYLKKGSQVLIIGEMQTRSWETDQGEKRYSTEVVCNRMQMLTPKSESVPHGTSEVHPGVKNHAPGSFDSNENMPF